MSSVRRLVPLHAAELETDPLTGRRGEIYFNTVSQELRVFNGTEWSPIIANAPEQYVLENHIHTYDGDIHTVYAGAYNPQFTIFDGGTAASIYDETTDIDAGTL